MKIVYSHAQTFSLEELPSGSIALDGAVPGGPFVDNGNHRYSFDHHEGCSRFCTSSACQQAFDAMLLGLDPSSMTVYVNDIDSDTVLALWLLKNANRWKDRALISKIFPLVISVGQRDCHGPVYPLLSPELPVNFQVKVMAPLQRFRKENGNAEPNCAVMEKCIAAMESWWIGGLKIGPVENEELVLPCLTQHETWVFADVKSLNFNQKAAGASWLYAKGYDRLVMCSHLRNGRFKYTLAKRSDFTAGFPLELFYTSLNQEEKKHREGSSDTGMEWGGSSTIGGSPRDGSVLRPEKVKEVIKGIIQNQ